MIQLSVAQPTGDIAPIASTRGTRHNALSDGQRRACATPRVTTAARLPAASTMSPGTRAPAHCTTTAPPLNETCNKQIDIFARRRNFNNNARRRAPDDARHPSFRARPCRGKCAVPVRAHNRRFLPPCYARGFLELQAGTSGKIRTHEACWCAARAPTTMGHCLFCGVFGTAVRFLRAAVHWVCAPGATAIRRALVHANDRSALRLFSSVCCLRKLARCLASSTGCLT